MPREEVDWYRARPTAAVAADVRRAMDELTVRARRVVFEHPEVLEADAFAAASATADSGGELAAAALGSEEQRRRARLARAVAELWAIGLQMKQTHALTVSGRRLNPGVGGCVDAKPAAGLLVCHHPPNPQPNRSSHTLSSSQTLHTHTGHVGV